MFLAAFFLLAASVEAFDITVIFAKTDSVFSRRLVEWELVCGVLA